MRGLENAVVRLLKVCPFYGHLLLGLRRQTTCGDGAVGITVTHGVPTLHVDAAAFAAYAPAEQEALLVHVLKHLLHLHPLRRKEHHPLLWDVACDLAINPTIDDLPVEAPQPGRYRLAKGLAAEEYYRALRRPFDTGNLSGDGYGTADATSSGTVSDAGAAKTFGPQAPLDNHRVWESAESTPQRLAETAVRCLVTQAFRQSGGEVPGDVRALAEGWLKPSPIPWQQVLRQFVGTVGRVGRTSTWMREHRRFQHDTPGQRKQRRLNLLVGVDVSDSTDQQALREAFARELLRIAAGRDSQLTVIYAGSRIHRIECFSGRREVAEIYRGGGFTDLRPVFAHVCTMQPRPAAVIYLTDGYGPAPQRQEIPTLWVLTGNGKKPAPWGVELRLGT